MEIMTFTISMVDVIKKEDEILLGRDNGKIARSRLEIAHGAFSKIEARNQLIKIFVPEKIESITYSYFAGMLEDRVVELGKIKFKQKYEFHVNDLISKDIDIHIDKILRQGSQQEILDHGYD